MTMFEQWLEAFQQACARPPERIAEVACPSCGMQELQLRFVDHRSDGKAYVDFWCSHCLQGIALGPSEVPAAYQWGQREDAHIPNYQLVPTTIYGQWLDALQQASDLSPERIVEVACPSCGARELQLRFVGHRAADEAPVAFWCSHCLQGISLRPIEVPTAYQPVRREDAHIPSYRLVPLPLFEQWLEAFQQACARPPERIAEVACPSCGMQELQLRFVEHNPEWRAFGAMWCSKCLKGISLGPCGVPAAYARIRPEDAHIPNFQIVPPE
jgi:DNA-directed RNA polymerase subunit M/transcription elongation factor TFIIS